MTRLCHHILLIMLLGFSSCADDIESIYSSRRAFFWYRNVATTPPLYTALSNLGMFCAIDFPNGNYRFKGANGQSHTTVPTEVAQYGRPEYISGFIVGTPSIPDLTTGSSVVAYDLVCPNCYENSAINKSLNFATPTTMKCPRCSTTYDLNNSGHGTSTGKLYRYHIEYAPHQTGGTVVIRN